jgi:hypothetical protein
MLKSGRTDLFIGAMKTADPVSGSS